MPENPPTTDLVQAGGERKFEIGGMGYLTNNNS
jgi:hypothetical protein